MEEIIGREGGKGWEKVDKGNSRGKVGRDCTEQLSSAEPSSKEASLL